MRGIFDTPTTTDRDEDDPWDEGPDARKDEEPDYAESDDYPEDDSLIEEG